MCFGGFEVEVATEVEVEAVMKPHQKNRVGDVASMLRLMRPLDDGTTPDPIQRKRQLLADLCRLVGEQFGAVPSASHNGHNGNNGNGHNGNGNGNGNGHGTRPTSADLPLRMRQTLEGLLAGDSEKQVAAKLGLSRHTVHVYVKQLYKHYDVSSRAELLAQWVKS
jgi:DNA-binding CsgD family transcriptional regulator